MNTVNKKEKSRTAILEKSSRIQDYFNELIKQFLYQNTFIKEYRIHPITTYSKPFQNFLIFEEKQL